MPCQPSVLAKSPHAEVTPARELAELGSPYTRQPPAEASSE